MGGLAIYPLALALASLVVAAAEAVAPRRREQRRLRAHFLSDLIHLVVNGHFLALWTYAIAARWILPILDHALARAGLITHVYRNAVAAWPLALQIVVALVAIDFLQWCVHNVLHRVSWLWELHKAHHSVVDGEMDFIVSFRFHWGEFVVYRMCLYLPLAWLGFAPTAVLVHAIVGTVVGHLNHANLDWGRGWWRYVVNSPRMHLWHHDYDVVGGATVNYGIIFSAWDWLFGTARLPDGDAVPRRLGFAGDDDFPTTFLAQAAWPLRPRSASFAGAVGLAIFAGGVALARWPGTLASTPMFGERAASSQPAFDHHEYASSPEQATAAIARFGQEARARGFARPDDFVAVDELAAALGSPRLALIDVRAAEPFARGHIPSAQRLWRSDYSTEAPVPGMSREKAALETALRKAGVMRDSVVVLCGDGGPEPYRLWWTLRTIGGYATRVLDGGLPAWKRAGRGLAEGTPRAIAAGDVALSGVATPPPLSWREIAPLVDGAVLVDARSAGEFTGAVQHPEATRAGHIPGARNLEWMALVDADDGRLRAPDEMRRIFAAIGVAGRGRVVSYCQTGTRSSVVYFALRQLGVDDVVNYNGSWSEYSRLALPLER